MHGSVLNPDYFERTLLGASYQVTGLPQGARFDSETLEVIWTPDYGKRPADTS